MRISNIQNFAANAVRSVSKAFSLQKTNSNSTQNDLDRSPAIDTVSFGKFGINGENPYEDEEAKRYVINLFLGRNMSDFQAINKSIYLDVVTKDSKNDIYSASLVSLRSLRSWESDRSVEACDRKIKNAYKEFNKENDLEEGWERKLHDEKDFRLLAELARHLNYNGYFSGKRESRLDDFGDPYSDSTGITGRWIF